MKRRLAQAVPGPPADPTGLRSRAELRLRGRKKGATARRTDSETSRLVHELEVHEIELSLQNEQLRETRDQLEASLERYTDLYDLAPTGYFSLDDMGVILEANLTGAAKLGVTRHLLIGRKLQRSIPTESRPAFTAFLARAFDGSGKESCEIPIRGAAGAVFWADVHATAASSLRDERRWCRVVVSDVTALKRAEQTQARLVELGARNRELDLEIARRRKVEQSLEVSERHQTAMLEKSNRMQTQLRRLSHGILDAHEEERKRISRELHDEIGQAVAAINIHLELISRQTKGESTSVKKRVAKTRRYLEEFVELVHRFCRELRPRVLDDLGLVPALTSFTHEFAQRTGIEVAFKPNVAAHRLNVAKSTVLYRIAQEALTNVGKHARATQVALRLHEGDGVICLVVADNGRAFDVARALDATQHGRLGLLGMRERVEMVGGHFSIESQPGKGTSVRVEIPLDERRAKAAPRRRR